MPVHLAVPEACTQNPAVPVQGVPFPTEWCPSPYGSVLWNIHSQWMFLCSVEMGDGSFQCFACKTQFQDNVCSELSLPLCV